MAFINWTSTQMYYNVAVVSGLVALLSTAMYFAAGPRRSKAVAVPTIIVSLVGGLLAGVGLGVLLMVALGYQLDPRQTAGGPPGGMPGGMPPGMPGMPPGMPGMPPGMPGGFPPALKPRSPTQHLAELVDKLDLLTGKAPHLRLDDKEKGQVRAQLQGLADGKALTQEEASKRLSALLELFKDRKTELAAVGYVWPGQAAPAAPALENPFLQGETAQHLHALGERLGKQAERLPPPSPEPSDE